MSALDDLVKQLDKAIGENHANQQVENFIDTGFPPLNKIMSGRYDGGLPMGRMVEMYGASSSGKTALATQWMVQAQKMGGVAGFVDWERSFDVSLAQNFGLTTDRPYWFYAKPKTWEEGNVYAAKVCKIIREAKAIDQKAPILFVFDSIASALPQSQAEKEIDTYTMNDTTALSRVTSTTLKSMAHHCEEFNATFLYLNQVRTKIGVMFGDPTTTPGGAAMEFYATARLSLSRQKIMEQQDGGKEFVGQNISIKCVKSKMTKPFSETSIRMSFDESGVARFDTITSLIDYMIDSKLIDYSKPRVTWTDGKQYFVKALAEKIRSEGTYDELVKILP